ncbi:MAG TPA: PQQ-binding-like beta-propeller repeat protein [Solirubrobacteraceae bacterium]|nr:PQQ-binding-like beta-propeller repeat protein [Solirubrobacteraceae bacterium]
MSDDFVSRLRLELREAAEREARRGPVRRAARTVRWDVASPPVLAATALIVAVLVAVAAGGALRGRDATPPVGTQPHVVAEATLVGTGGALEAGFGSVWAADNGTGEVLRVDPETRRVQARIRVGGQPTMRAAAGAIWATAEGRLTKIDPATNRVAARIDLRLTPRQPADAVPGRGVLWVITPLELLAVDPRGDEVTRRIPIARAGFQAASYTFDAGAIYVGRPDGVLLTFDTRTGARTSRVRVGLDAFLMAAADGRLLAATANGVAAIDPSSGRVVWQRDIGAQRVNTTTITGDGGLWVHGTDARTGRDRLWRMDARDGRVTGSLGLREFGVTGFAAVGDDVWTVSPPGRLVVVR